LLETYLKVGYLISKPTVPKKIKVKSSTDQCAAGLCFKGISSIDNLDRNFVQDIFLSGLVNPMASVLYFKLREEMGLCYTITAAQDMYSFGSSFVMYSLLEKKNINKTLSEMWKVLKDIKLNGFSKDMLESAKDNEIFSLYESTQKASDFSEKILDDYFRIGFVSVEERVSRIKRVTNKDIKRFANEILTSYYPIILSS
jgi:predicted Zn-dependent peptidase